LTDPSLGQYPQAIEFHQQHHDIVREIGDRNGEANSLFNMALSLAKLDRRWEARQHYEQSKRIYEELQLDHKIKECNTALYNLGQIIPAQVIRAPQIGDESDAPIRPRRRRKTPWWVWFLVGVAIVLAIAWWLRQ
jgi:tetratricopeptide (TPR) repeat protein